MFLLAGSLAAAVARDPESDARQARRCACALRLAGRGHGIDEYGPVLRRENE